MKSLKTAVLLLGPVFLIGLVGIYASRRPMPEIVGPPRIIVASLQLVPVTHAETELGYDTKAVAHFRLVGELSAPAKSEFHGWMYGIDNPRLITSSGKVLELESKQNRILHSAESYQDGEGSRGEILVQLKDWPLKESVRLEAEAKGWKLFNMTPGAKTPTLKGYYAKIPIRLELKKAGKKAGFQR